MDVSKIIIKPISTERSIGMMEKENKLIFIVERKARKEEISKAFETMFNIKPVKINTAIGTNGEKKAFVKLPNNKPAIDVATQLGLM
ncbi:50S ribosomal protein L23 [Candidatus Woesearchaeota archaeon]|nr:50S ribosomal protein L23 [Candidatus Woesearchaeota archaeon]